MEMGAIIRSFNGYFPYQYDDVDYLIKLEEKRHSFATYVDVEFEPRAETSPEHLKSFQVTMKNGQLIDMHLVYQHHPILQRELLQEVSQILQSFDVTWR